MLPPGTDDEGVISVLGESSIHVWSAPAHVFTTGWTITPWVQVLPGGPWLPLSSLAYSPTVTLTGDLEDQRAVASNITEIPLPPAVNAYVQLTGITGEVHAVDIILTTEHGLGDIHTPEDPMAHGSVTLDTPAATAIAGDGTYTKLSDTTVVGGSMSKWAHTNNRLTYQGSEVLAHQIVGIWSGGFGGIANVTLAFALGTLLVPASNATILAPSHVSRKVPVNDEGAVPLLIPTRDYTPGDYVELWAASNSADDITPTHYTYSATEVADT